MNPTPYASFLPYGILASLLALTGLYCIIVTRSFIRMLLGLELITKAVTLLIVVAGWMNGRMAVAQALAVTMIVVEVVVIVVAAGVILSVYEHTGTLDVGKLRNLKG